MVPISLIAKVDDLVTLSWEEMAKKIPDPPSTSTTPRTNSARSRRQSISSATRKKVEVRSTNNSDPEVSYGHQKMMMFCAQEELEKEPRALAHAMLLSLEPEEALQNLQKIYKTYCGGSTSTPTASRKGSFSMFKKKPSSSSISKAPAIEVSQYQINFGLQEGTKCPLQEKMTGEITVSIKAGKGKYSWWLPKPDPAYTLSVDPASGSFKKKGEQKFTVTVFFNSSLLLEELISLEVPGAGRFFFYIHLESERSVFGEDIRQYYNKGNVEIPPALVCMRDYLKEVDGFKEKNIFVKEGDEGEILAIRDKINREIFYDCRDVYALAKTLIAWFAEQPVLLMQSVSENLLLSAGGQQEYMSVLDMMRDPQQTLVIWALEVLVDVQLEQEHNGVDMDELSKLFGAALYRPQSADPTKNEKLPVSVAKMIKTLVNYRIKIR